MWLQCYLYSIAFTAFVHVGENVECGFVAGWSSMLVWVCVCASTHVCVCVCLDVYALPFFSPKRSLNIAIFNCALISSQTSPPTKWPLQVYCIHNYVTVCHLHVYIPVITFQVIFVHPSHLACRVLPPVEHTTMQWSCWHKSLHSQPKLCLILPSMLVSSNITL